MPVCNSNYDKKRTTVVNAERTSASVNRYINNIAASVERVPIMPATYMAVLRTV